VSPDAASCLKVSIACARPFSNDADKPVNRIGPNDLTICIQQTSTRDASSPTASWEKAVRIPFGESRRSRSSTTLPNVPIACACDGCLTIVVEDRNPQKSRANSPLRSRRSASTSLELHDICVSAIRSGGFARSAPIALFLEIVSPTNRQQPSHAQAKRLSLVSEFIS